MNIDSLWVEYDSRVPKALVEYKHEAAAPVSFTDANIQALTNLGNMAGLPSFVVRYAGDYSWFTPCPLNDHARQYLPQATRMTEPQWIELLYKCRGRTAAPLDNIDY